MAWFDELAELVREYLLEETRVGHYFGTVTNSGKTFRRISAKPDWLDQDGEELEGILRIASPILDVVYRVGTRVAILSQDGIPEAGAVIGAVTDDKEDPTATTVWIRADLETQEGHAELGATKSIRIQVGPNGGTITPLSNGTVQIEGDLIWLGDGPTDGVANGATCDAILGALDTMGSFVPVPGDGGLALQVAYLAALVTIGEVTGALTATESSKVKAE